MLFIDKTQLPAPAEPAVPVPTGPRMPWTIGMSEGFGGRIYRHKIRNGLSGELLSAEDEQIAQYVAHLEAENERLRAELEGRTTATTSEEPNTPAPFQLVEYEDSIAPADGLIGEWLQQAQSLPLEDIVPAAAPGVNEKPREANSDLLAGTNTANSQEIEQLEATADGLNEQPGTKRDRAIAVLLVEPTATNGVLAERAGCSDEYIRLTRKKLEAEGRLTPTPAKDEVPASVE